VMKDLIRCLGKTNAFAVVAVDKGAEMVLGSLREDPRLSSFAIAREPQFGADTAQALPDLFQPVLLLNDAGNKKREAEMAQLREKAVAAPEFRLSEKPQYYDNEAGRDMLVLFNAHQWKGALGLGLSKKMPQLTRTVGGISSFEGPAEAPDFTPDTTPANTLRRLSHVFASLPSNETSQRSDGSPSNDRSQSPPKSGPSDSFRGRFVAADPLKKAKERKAAQMISTGLSSIAEGRS